MTKRKTVHTRRTIMFTELSKVMDFSSEGIDHDTALENNVIGKTSGYNKFYTNKLLTWLYRLNRQDSSFALFEYFWVNCIPSERSLLALLFAIQNDFLLQESIEVIREAKVGEKVTIEKIQDNIQNFHKDQFAETTLRSAAQNIASSWKQAGFITGKVKNIRTQPVIGYHVVAFAFVLAYLHGERGDFVLSSKWAKALCLGDGQLRELAIEAARRDFLQYRYAGDVTTISFTNLFTKLGIDGI